MPCYLFTLHAHGTWMPDHPKGYVHGTRGLQPPDPHMADAYRANQREPTVHLATPMQQTIVATARHAARHLKATLHAVACEPTHVHILISWRHDRPWKPIRTSLQSALSRALNQQFTHRTWWAEHPSRKRVNGHDHFEHLILEYLPRHHGEQWYDPPTLTSSMHRSPTRRIHPRHRMACR